MRRSRTVGRSARPAWVTRAEAAFLAGVPAEDVDGLIETGRVPARAVGGVVLVDPSGLDLQPPAPPPAEARSARGARARSDRALRRPKPTKAPRRPRAPRPKARKPRRSGTRVIDRPAALVAGAAGLTAAALLVLQFSLFGGTRRPAPLVASAAPSPVVTATPSIPVGRDPFADPFGTNGKGDRSGGVLVKPPGVVRDGDAVSAATTVVNENDARWLPPSELTFVARDGNGRVIARASTTVSLGPGKAETVVAPDLGVDPSAIAAIEAHIHPAPLRSGSYHAPDVGVIRAATTDGGKAIAGLLSVGRGAPPRTRLACAMFDGLDELAGVATGNVALGGARGGRLRFWLTAQPTKPGPYKVSCSASAPARR